MKNKIKELHHTKHFNTFTDLLDYLIQQSPVLSQIRQIPQHNMSTYLYNQIISNNYITAHTELFFYLFELDPDLYIDLYYQILFHLKKEYQITGNYFELIRKGIKMKIHDENFIKDYVDDSMLASIAGEYIRRYELGDEYMMIFRDEYIPDVFMSYVSCRVDKAVTFYSYFERAFLFVYANRNKLIYQIMQELSELLSVAEDMEDELKSIGSENIINEIKNDKPENVIHESKNANLRKEISNSENRMINLIIDIIRKTDNKEKILHMLNNTSNRFINMANEYIIKDPALLLPFEEGYDLLLAHGRKCEIFKKYKFKAEDAVKIIKKALLKKYQGCNTGEDEIIMDCIKMIKIEKIEYPLLLILHEIYNLKIENLKLKEGCEFVKYLKKENIVDKNELLQEIKRKNCGDWLYDYAYKIMRDGYFKLYLKRGDVDPNEILDSEYLKETFLFLSKHDEVYGLYYEIECTPIVNIRELEFKCTNLMNKLNGHMFQFFIKYILKKINLIWDLKNMLCKIYHTRKENEFFIGYLHDYYNKLEANRNIHPFSIINDFMANKQNENMEKENKSMPNKILKSVVRESIKKKENKPKIIKREHVEESIRPMIKKGKLNIESIVANIFDLIKYNQIDKALLLFKEYFVSSKEIISGLIQFIKPGKLKRAYLEFIGCLLNGDYELGDGLQIIINNLKEDINNPNISRGIIRRLPISNLGIMVDVDGFVDMVKLRMSKDNSESFMNLINTLLADHRHIALELVNHLLEYDNELDVSHFISELDSEDDKVIEENLKIIKKTGMKDINKQLFNLLFKRCKLDNIGVLCLEMIDFSKIEKENVERIYEMFYLDPLKYLDIFPKLEEYEIEDGMVKELIHQLQYVYCDTERNKIYELVKNRTLDLNDLLDVLEGNNYGSKLMVLKLMDGIIKDGGVIRRVDSSESPISDIEWLRLIMVIGNDDNPGVVIKVLNIIKKFDGRIKLRMAKYVEEWKKKKKLGKLLGRLCPLLGVNYKIEEEKWITDYYKRQ
ncbi:hypothetical protein TCON_1928 [Astathelohania contejeani]|uniref:Uncharacterized protein n=1 Tax=Astathelohania contejeani TaxID=164912 RepID=A0ABQ7HXE9_9MICR|nr:hypothetical protein TCON_1928 [Thelohania contejeani]